MSDKELDSDVNDDTKGVLVARIRATETGWEWQVLPEGARSTCWFDAPTRRAARRAVKREIRRLRAAERREGKCETMRFEL